MNEKTPPQDIGACPGNQARLVGLFSLIALTATVIWLVLFICGMVRHGPVATFEEAMGAVNTIDSLFYLTYLNAALVTLAVTALFAGLYVLYRRVAPFWSIVAMLFVPAYTSLNLFAYLSQVTIIPSLVSMSGRAASQDAAGVLLAQMLQPWPDSIVSVLNNLGYAVLGIPSIIFGVLLARRTFPGGALLVLSGTACWIGFAGIIMDSPLLSAGSIAGGVLFLLALIPLTRRLLKQAGK